MGSDRSRLETTYNGSTESWTRADWFRPAVRHRSVEDSEGTPVTAAFRMAVANILDDAETLLISKQEDYGPRNISQSPFGPLFGLLVRMYDKQARAANLVSQGRTANHEAIEDTFIDLLNYSVIAMMVIRGQWPGVKAGDW